MPKAKRRNIGRRTRNATQQSIIRASQNELQRNQINETARIRNNEARSSRTQNVREIRNEVDRLRKRNERAVINRSIERNEENNLNRRVSRQSNEHVLDRLAFRYDPTKDYAADQSVDIGSMTFVCFHCKAMKFRNETQNLCCANGKIKLPKLNPPPEPLRTLMSGADAESKHFLSNIQKYNSCFQITSFGATNIVNENFMPTFKVTLIYFDSCILFGKFNNLNKIDNINQQTLKKYDLIIVFLDSRTNLPSSWCIVATT
jgi:hypothetical protein